jgi:hypothetical protein
MLRKILLKKRGEQAWIDVLPLALWAINDSPGVLSEYSPHKIVFGRDPPGFGEEPPIDCPKSSVSGEKWVQHMQEIRTTVSETLMELHAHQAELFNNKFRPINTYDPGDKVYVRILEKERKKTDPLFMGPCEVLDRVHDDTYLVSLPGGEQQVAFDRLKPFPRWEGRKKALFYYKPKEAEVPSGLDDTYVVEKIVNHRQRRGRTEWRVRWQGHGPEQDTWEPLTHFLPHYNKEWMKYCKEKELAVLAA